MGTDETKATIEEVFGSAGGYSDTAQLTDSNVNVLVQVIKEADSQYPSDYVQQDSSDLVKDEANVQWTTSSRTATSTPRPRATSVCPTTSATTGPSSLMAPA